METEQIESEVKEHSSECECKECIYSKWIVTLKTNDFVGIEWPNNSRELRIVSEKNEKGLKLTYQNKHIIDMKEVEGVWTRFYGEAFDLNGNGLSIYKECILLRAEKA